MNWAYPRPLTCLCSFNLQSNLLRTYISHRFSVEYSSGAPFYPSWTAASELGAYPTNALFYSMIVYSMLPHSKQELNSDKLNFFICHVSSHTHLVQPVEFFFLFQVCRRLSSLCLPTTLGILVSLRFHCFHFKCHSVLLLWREFQNCVNGYSNVARRISESNKFLFIFLDQT